MNSQRAFTSKQTMHRIVVDLLVALSLALGSGAWADAGDPAAGDACVRRAVDAIQSHYGAIRDMRARFEQTTRQVSLGGPGSRTTSRGTVVFAKPGKMRWSYESPEPSLVVSDGTWLWLYDPARREAQRLPVSEGYFSGAAIQFLLGRGEILREFRVSPLVCSAEAVELELVPREPASYEKLRVRAEPESGELTATTVFDLLGNVTRVDFSDIRTNQDPDPGVFVFEAPEGVRVVDLEPPAPAGAP